MLSPTETLDPNRPADATGQDESGYYKEFQTENGATTTYVYREIIPASKDEPLYRGWFRLLTPKPIPAWDWANTYVLKDSSWVTSKNVMPITVYLEEGVAGGEVIQSLAHADSQLEDRNDYRYSGSFDPELIFDRFLGWDKSADLYPTDKWQAFRSELQDDRIDTAAIRFSVSGNEYTWAPSPTMGTVVYIMNWDNTNKDENGFVEWQGYPDTEHFRSAFWGVDENGNIIGGITSKTPLNDLSLPERKIRWMVLYHTISILDSEDLTDYGFGSEAYLFAGLAGEGTPPYIIINP